MDSQCLQLKTNQTKKTTQKWPLFWKGKSQIHAEESLSNRCPTLGVKKVNSVTNWNYSIFYGADRDRTDCL